MMGKLVISSLSLSVECDQNYVTTYVRKVRRGIAEELATSSRTMREILEGWTLLQDCFMASSSHHTSLSLTATAPVPLTYLSTISTIRARARCEPTSDSANMYSV